MQEWQSPALDALAIWLSEDPSRIEARLAHRDAIQRFVVLFSCYTGPGNNEALDRLLDPFLRILRRSRKVCVRASCLSVLDMLSPKFGLQMVPMPVTWLFAVECNRHQVLCPTWLGVVIFTFSCCASQRLREQLKRLWRAVNKIRRLVMTTRLNLRTMQAELCLLHF